MELAPEEPHQEPTYPRGAIVRTVWSNGVVTYDSRNIGLGRHWAGCKVRIVPAGALIHVFHGRTLLRSLAFDQDRRYQRQQTRSKGGAPKR